VPARTVAAYLDHLERVDGEAAVALALGLLDDGVSPVDVLVDLVAVAQREVGRRWLTGRWNVAQEHAATHLSERVVDAVAGRSRTAATRGSVVLACVDGEWHALAARLVAEVIRLHGWRVAFLGASVPPRRLVSHLHRTGPDAVLLSCVQPSRLTRAARMVEACRLAGVPVLAGGPGFGPDGRWAAAVGAAAWGATARDAVDLLDRHVFSTADVGQPPRPVDDEYVAVLRRRRELTAVGTRAARPATEEDREELAAAVGHLVDALVAAVRVDDADLLVDFVRWQGDALAGHGGRAGTLPAVLDAVSAALREHPRAAGCLALAGAAVRG
jgi:methanogenic corrinoid protein MtbC1